MTDKHPSPGVQAAIVEAVTACRDHLKYLSDPLSRDLCQQCEAALSLPAPQPAEPQDTAENLKQAEALLGRIEALFPGWEGYRDLVDCIEVTLHNLQNMRLTYGAPSQAQDTAALVEALEEAARQLRKLSHDLAKYRTSRGVSSAQFAVRIAKMCEKALPPKQKAEA